MTKAELIKKCADKLNVKQDIAKEYLDTYCDIILSEIKNEKIIKFNLGQFMLKRTAERVGRDFNRNVEVVIPAKDTMVFVLNKKTKEAIANS